jgi:uncharacterized protein YraI
MKHLLAGLFALLLTLIAVPAAAAQFAVVTAWLNMRAGPGTEYPVITVIPRGDEVRVFGCVRGFSWCDVEWAGEWEYERGWVYSRYLSRRYAGNWQSLPYWGPVIGLPIIAFIFDDYLDRHYRDRPYYHDLRRWYHDQDRKRHRYRDKKWRGKRYRDKDWYRDRDRDKGRHRYKKPDRDRDKGGYRYKKRDRDRDKGRNRDDRDRDAKHDRDRRRDRDRGGDRDSDDDRDERRDRDDD